MSNTLFQSHNSVGKIEYVSESIATDKTLQIAGNFQDYSKISIQIDYDSLNAQDATVQLQQSNRKEGGYSAVPGELGVETVTLDTAGGAGTAIITVFDFTCAFLRLNITTNSVSTGTVTITYVAKK